MIRLDLYFAPSTRATTKSITSPSLTLTEKKADILHKTVEYHYLLRFL